MTRYTLRYEKRFRDQLDALELWLAAEAGRDVAIAFTETVLTRCRGLTSFPHRGTPRDEIRAGLRTVPHKGLTIGYRVDGDVVTILGIAGRGQSLDALTGDGA